MTDIGPLFLSTFRKKYLAIRYGFVHDPSCAGEGPCPIALGKGSRGLQKMKLRLLRCGLAALLLAFAGTAKADVVVNGGFELPVVGGPFTTFSAGSVGIPGWAVISGTTDPGGGSVDVVNKSFYPSHSGNQSLDLDGSAPVPAPGGVTQTLAGLTVGQVYLLDFFYANNPTGTTASANVTVDGAPTLAITHSGSTNAAMNYTEGKIVFVAAATTAVLTFQSTDVATSFAGIALDDVSVNAIPEPSAFAMAGVFGLGVGGLSWLRRKRAAV
jgi:Protein of unknown function (DUF642)